MPLVQAVCNVQIQLDNVPAMLVIRAPIVMLLVVVMLLGQVAQHVMLQQASVLVILAIQAPHVIHVPPTTIEQVMELVQVSVITYQLTQTKDILQLYFIFSLRL